MAEYFLIYDVTMGAQLWRGSGPVGIAGQQVLSASQRLIMLPPTSSTLPIEDIPLTELRASIWSQVKARRAAERDGGAATLFGPVDSQETEDVPARTNILGTTLAATIAKINSAPFAVTWTMLDNSELTFDADQMIGVGLAVLAHVNACYDRARQLRAQIDAAEDVAALLTIDISTGWPA